MEDILVDEAAASIGLEVRWNTHLVKGEQERKGIRGWTRGDTNGDR